MQATISAQIRALSEKHDQLAASFIDENEIERAITHKQFSHELQSIIIDQPIMSMPTWFECESCGSVNRWDRAYCRCGAPINWF